MLLGAGSAAAGCRDKPAQVGRATPLPRGAEPTPVDLLSVDAQVPRGVDTYQLWRVSWRGIEPKEAIFERYVRGVCFAQAHYVLSADGDLEQRPPIYRSASTGAKLVAKDLLYTEAYEVARGPKHEGEERMVERRPDKRLNLISVGSDPVRVYTFTYPEEKACVPPPAVTRFELPPKVVPSRLPKGPLPGETPIRPRARPAPAAPASSAQAP